MWQRNPPSPWEAISAIDGIAIFRLRSWAHFFDFLEAEVFGRPTGQKQLIWRGQRCSNWPLNTSLDRLFTGLGILNKTADELEETSLQHLEKFQLAARGRRGLNPAQLKENDWWALGQHYGLATPLLDWTYSPFAAAYFAFEDRPANAANETPHRIVFGLDKFAVEQRSLRLDAVAERNVRVGAAFSSSRPPKIEIIESMSDENPRLVSQGGLFTRSPIGTPIEDWVAKYFKGSTDTVLLRIEIPDKDRLLCLRTLNRMNINHLSLFPDLSGASRSTNLRLELGI